MLALLLVAAALAQAPAAEPMTGDAAAAAKLAGAAVGFGCILRLSAVSSAAEYAAGADEIGRGLKAQAPDVTTASLQRVDGRTCRVSYRGPSADVLWRADTDFHVNKQNNPCVETPATPTHAALSCAANAENPAYDMDVRREGDAVIVDVTYKGPRTR